MRGFTTWDWHELTFRAVAERAGVSERTVYRHFPTERHLHDAVMARLEDEAGIAYEDVDLDNLADVTARVFASLQRFAINDTVGTPQDPRFRGRRSATPRRPATVRSPPARRSYPTPTAARWPGCSTCCGARPPTSDWSACGTSRAPRPSMPFSG